MEKPPMSPNCEQSVVSTLEGQDVSNNGNIDNLLSTAEIDCNNISIGCDKNEFKIYLDAAISEKSKQKVQNILEQVNTLIPIEKLLLYLKLPTEKTSNVDPLRQPLNPLGSRIEISQTIMWIKTHLEEDPEISLQKKGVYEEYVQFCGPNHIKPLSTADFGKVMKQVYPKVRPRRLGTRGNSQYCYSGLRKRVKLSKPLLPDLSDIPESTESFCNQSDLYSAAWTIVKEWSETKLGCQFYDLHNLAYYLINNLSIGMGSVASLLVTSTMRSQLEGESSSCVFRNRHKETMRKIQQKCEGKDQKRKLQVPQFRSEQKYRSKKAKVQCPSTSSSTSPIVHNEVKVRPSQGLQPVCDKSLEFTNLQMLPDFSSFQRSTGDKTTSEKHQCDAIVKDGNGYVNFGTEDASLIGKVAIPRLNTKQSPVLSPRRIKNFKYKHIQPKPELCDINYDPQPSLSSGEMRSHETIINKSKKLKKKNLNYTNLGEEQATVHFTRERLISIGNVSKDALDDYLGTNNSQENEEELMKYFEHDQYNQEQDSIKKEKLSQLRILLEQNCPNFCQDVQQKVNRNSDSVMGSNVSAFSRTNKSLVNKNVCDRIDINIHSHLQTNVNSVQKYVSLDMHVHEDSVPPSPNTRRKNFSFTPISPGPHSPTGRQSKCSSTNASPFVSPRNTPVPRARGNSHTYCGNQNISTGSAVTRKQAMSSKKVKHELDLNVDVNNTKMKEFIKYPLNMPMSAPPSPKTTTNFLQNILKSNQKCSYTPTYNQSTIQNINAVDQLSPEVSHLLSNSIPQGTLETGNRSQSVPVSIPPNSSFTNFQLNINTEQTCRQSEFNGVDNIPENVNVNKIIDSIDQTNLGTFLDDQNLQLEQNEYCNVDSAVDINNIPLHIETESFNGTSNSTQFDKCANLKNTSIDMLPNLQGIGRSQTLDMDDSSNANYMKCNPSRSVPSTPVPYTTKVKPIKIDVNHYSRSYPSTPLSNETFNYNQKQDYLLNGQPIKEKISEDTSGDLLNIVNRSDIFENMVMYNVEGLSNLNQDNKNNFNFKQISESNFGAKQNIDSSNQEYEVIENNFFKGVSDISRT